MLGSEFVEFREEGRFRLVAADRCRKSPAHPRPHCSCAYYFSSTIIVVLELVWEKLGIIRRRGRVRARLRAMVRVGVKIVV